ncbi:phage holin family protein [Streptomyces sp. NPDC096057]|uniref:phage holin family protein n=1 Tax=Streptomyces sp. NPDC096057 TaxID=3155543 RepID=UPI00332A888B
MASYPGWARPMSLSLIRDTRWPSPGTSSKHGGAPEESVGEWVQRATQQLMELIHGVMRLAQAEMMKKGRHYGKGGGLFGRAGLSMPPRPTMAINGGAGGLIGASGGAPRHAGRLRPSVGTPSRPHEASDAADLAARADHVSSSAGTKMSSLVSNRFDRPCS